MKYLLAFALLLMPASSVAERLRIPLSLSERFIESQLRSQAFTAAGGSVRINDDGSGCQYLELRNPVVTTRPGQVLIQVAASARAGRKLGGNCLLVLNWHGRLELVQQPAVADDRAGVLLRTVSWRALKTDGSADNLSTTIGRWLEQYLPADLQQTHISFRQLLTQLREFLALVITDTDAGREETILSSLAVDDVTVAGGQATVTIGLEVPPIVGPLPAPEPALNAVELALLQEHLDSVDAFFTYTARSLGREVAGAESAALLEVLMGLRHQLIDILQDDGRTADDPARLLFVDAWDALLPVLRTLTGQQADAASALRYMTFVSAGDALRALDDLGPAAGIEISTDGLRRLARILIPNDAADPLHYGDTVDPSLRASFGFGPPLPPPQFYDDSSAWMNWLFPAAYAAGRLEPSVAKKLNNWVPKSGDMGVYLPMVRDVLNHVISERLQADALEPSYHDLYRTLVLAAAWQESCWRQFVAQNDKRVPMQSGSGDIGMMQINPRVWRGFYDLHGLRWDIVYNARAGADILAHHLINYAISKGEHRATGSVDSLARATYAAYNGGPRQFDRYRRAGVAAQEKKIDTLFFEKYRAIRSDGQLAVTACYGG